MPDIAGERRRLGYRRVGLMLEREGIEMNHKKPRWLYREQGLAVKRRRKASTANYAMSACRSNGSGRAMKQRY
jgi:hypothetical protein